MNDSLSSTLTTLATVGSIDTPVSSVKLIHITTDAVFHPDVLRPAINHDDGAADGGKRRRAAQLDLDLDLDLDDD